MDIFLTGGTGYIGSQVLEALAAHGDAVRALARSDDAARAVEAAGATAVRGALADLDLLRAEAARAEVVIHTASPGDATSPGADRAAAEAFRAAGRHVHTGGIWSFGNTHGGADEGAPLHPPAMTQWRTPIEEDVLARGGVVVMPGVVYGDGRGLLPLVFGEGRYVGDGHYHVAVCHVEDVALAYVLALHAQPGTRLLAVAQTVSARDLAEAFAGAAGGTRSETLAEASERLGEGLAGAMALDQRITAVRTRGLGWSPAHRDVLAEIRGAG